MISRLIGSRLVLCIDEFQRIGVLNTTSRNRILSGIRTAFSRNPRYLSVILAIQSMVERSALDLLPTELKTLIGRKPSISLPEMDVREGKEFIAGRFACFRPAGYRCTEFAPFEAAAIDGVLEFLHSEAQVALIPREILQTFAYIYDEVGTDSMISRETAVNIVASLYEPKD